MADSKAHTASSTSFVSNEPTWKDYHNELAFRMAFERLRDAMQARNHEKLLRVVEDTEHVAHSYLDDNSEQQELGEGGGDTTSWSTDTSRGSEATSKGSELNKLIHSAKHLAGYLKEKQMLTDAKATTDIERLRQAIEHVKQSRHYGELQTEVWEAEQRMRALRELVTFRKKILDMDRNTMSELRRYLYPAEILHKVLQAALLLLGEDEETTKDWQTCQKLCNPYGSTGLRRRVMDFKVSSLDPRIAARVRQILQGMEIKAVQKVSPLAGTFYVWAMGVIDEWQNNSANNQSISQFEQPASITRQREIFREATGSSPTVRGNPARSWVSAYAITPRPSYTRRNIQP